MNQIVIGQFIALKRKEKNLTQGQLAEMLNISNKTISKWETGKSMPDYSLINPLCEALDVTVSELLEGQASYNSMNEKQLIDLVRKIQQLEDQKIMFYGIIIPFLTVGYIKKGEKCLFKGVFLPFKIVVWEASYEIFFIFLLSSLG